MNVNGKARKRCFGDEKVWILTVYIVMLAGLVAAIIGEAKQTRVFSSIIIHGFFLIVRSWLISEKQ